MPDNVSVWKSPELVRNYLSQSLFAPERAVIDLLRPDLRNYRMLDLGVGAGRTTRHFAPMVREYVGLDYSPAMIESCRQKFGHLPESAFVVGDARNLDFPSGSFDFVLFSFNGLDSMDRPDREKVLLEANRVLRKGGFLFFSTHNARSVKQVYAFQFPRDPRRLLWEYQRYRRIQEVNGPESRFSNREWFQIKDGACDFRLSVFYILPELQVADLEGMGFRDVKAFGFRDGSQLSQDGLRQNTESWLHYLCTSA